jgi:hypothetical protein
MNWQEIVVALAAVVTIIVLGWYGKETPEDEEVSNAQSR